MKIVWLNIISNQKWFILKNEFKNGFALKFCVLWKNTLTKKASEKEKPSS